jgi:hypothetical protein
MPVLDHCILRWIQRKTSTVATRRSLTTPCIKFIEMGNYNPWRMWTNSLATMSMDYWLLDINSRVPKKQTLTMGMGQNIKNHHTLWSHPGTIYFRVPTTITTYKTTMFFGCLGHIDSQWNHTKLCQT